MRYFYAWTPLVIVTAAVILAGPYLAVFALIIVALVPAGGLAWAIVSVRSVVIGAVSRDWHRRPGATSRTAVTLSPGEAPKRVAGT